MWLSVTVTVTQHTARSTQSTRGSNLNIGDRESFLLVASQVPVANTALTACCTCNCTPHCIPLGHPRSFLLTASRLLSSLSPSPSPGKFPNFCNLNTQSVSSPLPDSCRSSPRFRQTRRGTSWLSMIATFLPFSHDGIAHFSSS